MTQAPGVIDTVSYFHPGLTLCVRAYTIKILCSETAKLRVENSAFFTLPPLDVTLPARCPCHATGTLYYDRKLSVLNEGNKMS
jgi:hypothetical protein